MTKTSIGSFFTRVAHFLLSISIALSILLTNILTPQSVSAHVAGQPPFFMINGTYSNFYHVLTSSLTSFTLPQDGAPANYLVNIPIQLQIDTNKMQVPPDIIAQTKFQWDFGDGTKGHGLQNTHTYTKPGSFFIFIYALSPDSPTPQLIESVLLNILPNASYKLPQAKVKINGQQSKNPTTDILQTSFAQSVSYDGRLSQNGSGKIVSYFWDLGDEQSATGALVTHTLPNQYYMAFPILRVKDNNGFISDAFVQINNTTQGKNAVLPKKNSPTSASNRATITKKPNYTAIGVGGLIVLVILSFLIVLLSKRSKKH